MTTNPGTYALLLHVEDEQIVEVGALGVMTVRPGVYVYLGSAFGPGGLRARVKRHARNDGAQHWHVDYLRAVTTLETVWYTHDATRRECVWAEIVRSLPGATVPMEGFGASNCNCPAHLTRFESAPFLSTFRTRLLAHCPDHATVSRLNPSILSGQNSTTTTNP